jgi:hypothetical protein
MGLWYGIMVWDYGVGLWYGIMVWDYGMGLWYENFAQNFARDC